MKMTILQRADDITHVVLDGRLDTTGAEEINESFFQATAARERPAIVELSQVDFMASRGIGVLLTTSNRLRKVGHKLVLLSPQEIVESALRTTRVDAIMPIAHDLDEAIRIVHGVQVQSSAASLWAETPADKPRMPRSDAERTGPSILEGELKLAIKNEISELKNLTARLAQFLDAHHVPARAAYAVNLAVDELVVNVIRYAYVDDDTHLIALEFAIQGDQVILRIVDDGRPFDPRTGPSLDLNAEERRVGGLGLLLVLDMVDVLKYQRLEERNWVEVRVHLFREDNQSDLSAARSDSGEPSRG
jgi:anti-anti-sigma factor